MSEVEHVDVAVIGAGPGGSSAAAWAARAIFDAMVMDAAVESGATLHENAPAEPWIEDDRVVGVISGDRRVRADLTVIASGAGSPAARMVGAERVKGSPYGLAIRGYITSTRADDSCMEACLTVAGPDGRIVPGYGWVFPAGDGLVNIGVGALSTMQNFSDLNLNTMLDAYTAQVRDSWGLGEFTARPKAWRLPMHVERRGGPGWVVVGDAAGLVNPFNGEGIDYALESGRHAAECFLDEPGTAWAAYQALVRAEYDPFFDTARRFAWVIGRPKLLSALLGVALSTGFTMRLVLDIMANLIDARHPGLAGRALSIGGRGLALADPLLTRVR